MGNFKEQSMLIQDFEETGKLILAHKYLYYIKNRPLLSDYEFDMLEYKYTKMAKELIEKPEISMISDWDELEWLNNATIIDFPHNHLWAQEAEEIALKLIGEKK